MTAAISKPSSAADSLTERLRAALTQQGKIAPTPPAEQCLLLDVSGSMAEDVEAGRPKIVALREIAAQFPATRKIAFGDRPQEITGAIPDPDGITNLATALRYVRKLGISHAVLITDGMPSEPESACLAAARGLKLDIFYVGPLPAPPFLAALAQAANGSYQSTTMAKTQAPQLAKSIKTLLLGSG